MGSPVGKQKGNGMNYPYNNPPINLWDRNNFTQPQTPYQQLQPIQKAIPPVSVACYTVNSKEEMNSLEPQLNVLYVGINTSAREIYTKQLNNSGLVDSYVYTQFSNEQKQENEILKKLSEIETRLGGRNVNHSNTTATGISGAIPQQSNNGTIQPTYARQEQPATNANASQPRQVQGY